jgi:hypothetical protein
MKHLPPTLIAMLLLLALSACNWIKPKVKIPDHPYLQADSINTFEIGDRFIISESYNSCCMYCFLNDSTLKEQMPVSSHFKLVETIEDPADPDCAGCSSHHYSIMECVATGVDTIQYFVIPMGDVGEASNCSELGGELIRQLQPVTYILTINELALPTQTKLLLKNFTTLQKK